MSKRDIESLWNDLNTEKFSQAFEQSFRLLKKNPDNAMLTALAALSCHKLNRKLEALELVDKLNQVQTLNVEEASIVQTVLCGYGLFSKVNDMTEAMYKKYLLANQSKKAIDLLNNWYISMLENGYFKGLLAVSLVFQKLLPQNEYVVQRVVFSYYLMCTKSKDQLSATELKLYPMLAAKTLEKVAIKTPQQVYLKALVLSIQDSSKSRDLADFLMKDDLCRHNSFLETKILRLDTLKKLHLWSELFEECKRYLTEELDNWVYWEALVTSAKQLNMLDEALEFVDSYATSTKVKHIDYRNRMLAKVYLRHNDDQVYLEYFDQFGGKSSTYQDLYPLIKDGHKKWITSLSFAITEKPANVPKLVTILNVIKLKQSDLSVTQLANMYTNSMHLLKDKDPKDYHPGDEFLLLAMAKILSTKEPSNSDIVKAIVLLERAAKHDKHQFHVRLWLICLYQMLGAFNASAAHFKTLSIKNMQIESLSHLLLGRLSTQMPMTFNHTAWLKEADSFYSETPDLGDGFVRAFQDGIYTKIAGMFDLLDNLTNSVTKTLLYLEKIRLHRHKFSTLKAMESTISLDFDTEVSKLNDNRDCKTIGLCLPKEHQDLYNQLDIPHRVSKQWLEIQLLYEDLIFEGLTPFNGTLKEPIKKRIEEKATLLKNKLSGDSGLTDIECWSCEMVLAITQHFVFKETSIDLMKKFNDHKTLMPATQEGLVNWHWVHYAFIVLDTAKILKRVPGSHRDALAKETEEIKSKSLIIKKENDSNKQLAADLGDWASDVGIDKVELVHVIEGILMSQNETIASIRNW